MRLDHINIRTDDLEGVKDILVRILGLEVGDRPPFPFPGYWLYGEGCAVVHLTERTSDPGTSTGALDHVAFKDNDFDGLIARLTENAMTFDAKTIPGSGMRQVFFKIHHDVSIEVNIAPG